MSGGAHTHGVGVAYQGESYEDMYCKGTEQRGVIILGDSAAAHFHVRAKTERRNVTVM